MKYILVINLVVTRIIHNTHIFLHSQPTCLVSVRHEGIFIILAEGDLECVDEAEEFMISDFSNLPDQ